VSWIAEGEETSSASARGWKALEERDERNETGRNSKGTRRGGK